MTLSKINLLDTQLSDLRLRETFKKTKTKPKEIRKYTSKDPNNRLNIPYYHKVNKLKLESRPGFLPKLKTPLFL